MQQRAERLYWLGNIAKTRIISEILSNPPPSDRKVIVFDYGCGDGGDWPGILRDHAHLQFVGYEPEKRSFALACNRLAGLDAELLTGNAMNALSIKADYIVSFSVFEHVVNKHEYLYHAKRVLAEDGLFFLNYDDGHFRNLCDLSEPSTWLPALRSRLRTMISPFMAALGQQANYQQRVIAEEADQMVKDAGFRIKRVDYHNLASLKDLAKSIPDDLKEIYAKYWLDAEITLNSYFQRAMLAPQKGDSINLWRQMPSRTLCLGHCNT